MSLLISPLTIILKLSVFRFIDSLLFYLFDTIFCSIWMFELFFLIVNCYVISSIWCLLFLMTWLSGNIFDEHTFIDLTDCWIIWVILERIFDIKYFFFIYKFNKPLMFYFIISSQFFIIFIYLQDNLAQLFVKL